MSDTATNGLRGEREPAYFCMHCPCTFTTAAASNEHHRVTGHHQHWLRELGYEARQQRAAVNGGKPEPVRHPDTFMALQTAILESLRAVAESCRPQGERGRSHAIEATPRLVAAMTAVRAELRGLPALDAQQLAERLHNLTSRAAAVHGQPPAAAAWLDLPLTHRHILATACELLLQGES